VRDSGTNLPESFPLLARGGGKLWCAKYLCGLDALSIRRQHFNIALPSFCPSAALRDCPVAAVFAG